MSVRVIVAGGLRCAQSLWCIHRGFERAGCNVRYVPTAERGPNGKKHFRTDAAAEIAEAARAGADILYWWQPHSNAVPVGYIEGVRAEFPKMRTIMQSLDDPYVIDRAPPEFKEFEMAVTCCESSIGWYAARGVRAVVGYPPVDRDLNGAAVPNDAERCDLSFVGTNVYPPERYRHVLASRADMVRILTDLGRLHLYGYWDQKCCTWGGKLGLSAEHKKYYRGWWNYPDLPGVYAASRINLCSHVRPDGYRYLNERVGQAMASGGFLLCDRVNGIGEIFRENEEIILWKTLPELHTKATWWLAHEAERRRVAAAGRLKALELFDNARLALLVLKTCGF